MEEWKQTPESMEQVFSHFMNQADRLYQFVMIYHDYIACQRDYGTGQLLNMVEVHILTLIDENPGVTVTRLSYLWNRTKGAISQTVKKLEQKGFIYRQKEPGNAKEVHFFTTRTGELLSRAHKEYDARDISETLTRLLQRHTPDELETFYRIISTYSELMLEDT